jgi:hypothetical protein
MEITPLPLCNVLVFLFLLAALLNSLLVHLSSASWTQRKKWLWMDGNQK